MSVESGNSRIQWYVTAIKGKLDKNRVHYDEKILCALQGLNERNLQSLLYKPLCDGCTVLAVLNDMLDSGVLVYVPYILQSEKQPKLAVRSDTYIKLSSDYGFVSSNAADDSAPAMEVSGIRFGDILAIARSEGSVKDPLLNLLCYAHFMCTALEHKNVYDWFISGEDISDEFIHTSYLNEKINLLSAWSDVMSLITVSNANHISANRKVYRISSGSQVMCEFAIGAKTIEVATAGQNSVQTWTLHIPAADEFIQYKLDKVVIDSTSMNKYATSTLLLLSAMLCLAGIRLNWISNYPLRSLVPFNGVVSTDTVPVYSFKDVVKYSPDEF